jgi:3-deoxy-manno-octulosonate cytidylyltransferase (CMP-KDO synthetase)
MFRVVIPARFGSTRLPGKPLMRIGAKPMLQWVHEAAIASGAAEVIIATDDERILEAAAGWGARAQLTSLTHLSGTDRIAEVALEGGWNAEDIVVNLQGDEPMMPPALISQVAGLLEAHPSAAIATLATRISGVTALMDPNTVKVVMDAGGRALYFSRAPVPWGRDTAPAGIVSQRSANGARRHIGLYAYRVAALRRLSMLPPGVLEQLEKLEQLRALENGLEIRVADAVMQPGPDVNSAEDLARVAVLLGRSTEGAP